MTTHEFKGHKFTFESTKTIQMLITEIFNDNYKVLEKKVEFSPGDVILDIGANEGVFSIFMSKLFPLTRIIALEPVPSNYDILLSNIKLNSCTNIEPLCIGVGRPGQRSSTLYTNRSGENSGGASNLFTYNPNGHDKVEARLISLDEVFTNYNINRCRLLKMDIEGAEYDVLYPSTILPLVDYMTIEIHTNQRLDFQARRPMGLAVWVGNQTNLIHAEICKMAE